MKKILCIAVFLIGCGRSVSGQLDNLADLASVAMETLDMSEATAQDCNSPTKSNDLSISADLASADDLSAPADLAVPADLATPADLAVPCHKHHCTKKHCSHEKE